MAYPRSPFESAEVRVGSHHRYLGVGATGEQRPDSCDVIGRGHRGEARPTVLFREETNAAGFTPGVVGLRCETEHVE